MFLGAGLGYVVQNYYLRDDAYGKLMILACALTHTTSIQISLTESLNNLLGELTQVSTYTTDIKASERYDYQIPKLTFPYLNIFCYSQRYLVYHDWQFSRDFNAVDSRKTVLFMIIMKKCVSVTLLIGS